MADLNIDTELKSIRLRKFVTAVIDGKRAIKNRNDSKLFIEAICDFPDPSTCVEKLVAASHGLQAVKASLRTEISSAFINESSANFLKYVADDSVRQLCNGQLLRDILIAVLEPPTFWNALQRCYSEKCLSPSGIHAYACLLHELLLSPSADFLPTDIFDIAEKALAAGGLHESPSNDTRSLGYKIQDAIRCKASGTAALGSIKPGGRHDNDFEDFRQIAIFPTTDEFLAKEQPFYLQSEVVFQIESEKRAAAHLDNQFRLLREDMLAELRNDLQISRGIKQGKRASVRLKSLVFHGVYCGSEKKRKPALLALRCYQGLPKLSRMTLDERKKHYADNKNLLKHMSFGCLLCSNEIVAFATVDRNEDMLAEDPPVILLQVLGNSAFLKALISLKTVHQEEFEFVQVDTPFFAYEPVLRCLQEKPSLPLANELLDIDDSRQREVSPFCPEYIVAEIKQHEGRNLRGLLRIPKDVILDHSQTESLVAGLTQNLGLIQGPPGTGKSFIGAILAKILHDHSHETILVLCYTNHALDQFLEEILDIGVSEDQMLRLGSKSKPRTKSLGLYEQSGNTRYQRSPQSWALLNKYSDMADNLSEQVQKKSSTFRNLKISNQSLLDFIQFSDHDSEFFAGLSVPDAHDGMAIVGERGMKIGSSYLIDRWVRGQDAGVFQSTVGAEFNTIWNMDKSARRECYQRWCRDLSMEQAAILRNLIDEYNESYKQHSNVWDEKYADVIGRKRIIGCTTTAAAKYTRELLSARPGIILVEEAGEILESHVLTALSPNTKHLVLIGDHQQLRPKVNNYALTIERGDGYDLNKSLFERLVLGGYPHTTLAKQHRMRPEISALVKRLMYPNLEDDSKTLSRPHLRGFQSDVVFFNHSHPEVQANNLADRRDEGSKVSRQNIFEAEMVLKTVRYLAQQGYGTDRQVVLTPYLGQLGLLLRLLKEDLDPVLNDLDSFDLVRAGLMPSASSNVAKRPLRMSTIDNYQGEESDIVIASLTRSNDNGDIGFMAAPQRLNVLLSRARDGLIIIGNANSFTSSRKGANVWVPFVEQLSEAGQLYDGLPVKCERHPKKVSLLKNPDEFDLECPDGGCSEPCRKMLSCGKHTCPQQCHQLFDHSKVKCKHLIEDKCSQNHTITWECWKESVPCGKCEAAAKRREAQRQRDHALDQQRQSNERQYAKRLAEVDDEIAHERRLQREGRDQLYRERVLQQRKKDLDNLRKTARREKPAKSPDVESGNPTKDSMQKAEASEDRRSMTLSRDPSPANVQQDEQRDEKKNEREDERPEMSGARSEWEYQKEFENADNEHLDSLIEMIGLESVKEQVLTIKAKIDTCIRQAVNVKSERFGAVLLGNPGTGKTTVARLYAKFLASVGVLPGTTVMETTGARLINDGVSACKKLIEDLLNEGGGAIFIDEAYQLTSNANPGGANVLDFLLAEVENLTGKIVFILAGYNKQMEKFFARNPGLPSRFPHEFQFKDYDDKELRQILEYQVKKRFNGRMKAEDGLDGLYCRIVARRVGYGRGREGFGNARAIENTFSRILSQQAKRLARERRARKMPDDMLLTQEDLIGPEPSNALNSNKSWEKLKQLTGLQSVKDSVESLFESIQYNYERELDEKPLLEFNLNRVFLGSPGTGKTTVAKLYGQILADIGFLSIGEVVVKNPSDFVGDVLGASEKTTKGVLASTVGKVLLIDEAYGLYGGSNTSGSGANADPYKTAVIDTIVAEVQSVPGDDRCVLLIGYKSQMEAMFQNVNPGLSRRFPLSEAFEFEDFTDDELKEIFKMKLKQQAYDATDQATRVAMDVLKRARNRPNFGNAGEVDILLNSAKARHQQRRSARKTKANATLEAIDMDPDFDRGERAATNVRKLFEGVVGCDDLVTQLEGYQNMVANMKARDMDPREQIPFNFLFRGPPGTGKTTTARKMGKIYYDMGFLATAEVVEVSATDLVGEYIGQTGPKTQKLLEKALGKVLFIDEAYRLAEGPFAKEAMDEIVDCITKPTFAQKLVIMLAGYDADINRLMSINPGLTSRFPETISFRSLSAVECLELFTNLVKNKKHLDAVALESASTAFQQDLLRRFEVLANLPNWANARDVGTLVKSVYGQLLRTADQKSPKAMRLEEAAVLTAIDAMITERSERAKALSTTLPIRPNLPTQTAGPRNQNKPPPPNIGTQTSQLHAQNEELPPEKPRAGEENPQATSAETRDADVSDQIWARLQLDKQATAVREKQYHELLAHQTELKAEHTRQLEKDRQKQHEEQQRQEEFQRHEEAGNTAEEDEAKRRFELERIQREFERRAREEELARLERERKAAEEERAKEAAAQKKLRKLGVCVAGFRWIKQAGGYRCAGGFHFVSDTQLGMG